jgi:hypothetical protein
MQFFRLLPKISPNLGYIFTPRPSYFKVLDLPLPAVGLFSLCAKMNLNAKWPGKVDAEFNGQAK